MRRRAGVCVLSAVGLAIACGKSESPSNGAGGSAGKGASGAPTAGSSRGGSAGSAGQALGGSSGTSGSSAGRGTAGGGTAAVSGGSAGNAGTTSIQAGSSGAGNPAGGESGEGGAAGAGGEDGETINPPGGQITIAYVKEIDAHHFAQTSAGFWRSSVSSNTPSPCEVQTYGACTVTTCPSTPPDPPPPPTVAAPGAGTLSLTAAAASYAKTLNPDAGYGAYGADIDTTVDFLGGESVSISAAGGEIPAFSGTVVMPVPLSITTVLPARDTNGSIPFRVAEDLVLEVSGGMPDVVVQVDGRTGISGGPTKSSLSCFVESESGTLTIPSEALTPLGTSAFVVLYTLRRSSLITGDYDILVVFGTNVNANDGLLARFAGKP